MWIKYVPKIYYYTRNIHNFINWKYPIFINCFVYFIREHVKLFQEKLNFSIWKCDTFITRVWRFFSLYGKFFKIGNLIFPGFFFNFNHFPLYRHPAKYFSKSFIIFYALSTFLWQPPLLKLWGTKLNVKFAYINDCMKTSKQLTHLTPIIIIHYSCICNLILSTAAAHFVQERENQKNSGEIQ